MEIYSISTLLYTCIKALLQVENGFTFDPRLSLTPVSPQNPVSSLSVRPKTIWGKMLQNHRVVLRVG